MLTNKLKYLRLILLPLLAAVFIPVIVAGTENKASATTQDGAATEQPVPASPEAETTDTETQQAADETPSASGAATGPVKEFKPTEKIEADSAVSLPIDI